MKQKSWCTVALLCIGYRTTGTDAWTVPQAPNSRLLSRPRFNSLAAAGGHPSASLAIEPQTRKVGWHRRVWKKVLRRPTSSSSSSQRETQNSLNMQTLAMEGPPGSATTISPMRRLPSSLLRRNDTYSDYDFIMHNFESTSPSDILPLLVAPSTAGILVMKPPSTPIVSVVDVIEQSTVRRPPITRVLRSWGGSLLLGLLEKWSKGAHVNLNVSCEPNGSPLELLLRGHFRCDARVDFDRIVFGAIRMSGGYIEAKGLALNVWSFAPQKLPGTAPCRYPDPFDFEAHNITFTQEDLFESNCIRNGLKRLLTRILKGRGLKAVRISIGSIEILRSGKISCQGEATTSFGSSVPFEVRSRIGLASRGHIVTFPGLEIALGAPLFVPVLPEVTVDLGHNAQLLHIDMDGRQRRMHVSARVTITPEHTIKLREYSQSTQAYGALCSVDVGRWLTKLGRFTH